MEEDEFASLALAELDAVMRAAGYLDAGPQEAEDLVEDTYRQAFAAVRPRGLDPRSLRTWLFGLLYDAAARFGDPLKTPTPIERLLNDAPIQVAGQTPSCYDLSALDWGHVHGKLRHAIRGLPPPYRVVFLLWGVERLRYHEIAEVLHMSVGVVRARLYRARMIVSTDLGELATEWGLGAPVTDAAR